MEKQRFESHSMETCQIRNQKLGSDTGTSQLLHGRLKQQIYDVKGIRLLRGDFASFWFILLGGVALLKRSRVSWTNLS